MLSPPTRNDAKARETTCGYATGVDGINKVRTANAGMAIATRGMANKPNRQRHDVYFNDGV